MLYRCLLGRLLVIISLHYPVVEFLHLILRKRQVGCLVRDVFGGMKHRLQIYLKYVRICIPSKNNEGFLKLASVALFDGAKDVKGTKQSESNGGFFS